jgi:hypothetical protein
VLGGGVETGELRLAPQGTSSCVTYERKVLTDERTWLCLTYLHANYSIENLRAHALAVVVDYFFHLPSRAYAFDVPWKAFGMDIGRSMQTHVFSHLRRTS